MWEQIPEPEDTTKARVSVMSHRLKVPGGWIVRTVTNIFGNGTSSSQTFVADADHSWELS